MKAGKLQRVKQLNIRTVFKCLSKNQSNYSDQSQQEQTVR